jgi:hypothetical protein
VSRRFLRLVLLGGLGVVLLMGTACGKKPPAPVTVKGQVKRADGRPLPPISLAFHPQDEANRGRLVTALPDAKDGTFVVQCPPGRYRVTIAPLNAGGEDPAAAKDGKTGALPATPDALDGLPPRYQSPGETDWKDIEIPEGGRTDLVLVIKGTGMMR